MATAKTAPRKAAPAAPAPAAKPAAKPAATAASKPAAAPAPAKAAAAPSAPKPAAAPAPKADKPAKAKKPKAILVRDGFTMPEADFALIATLKARAMAGGREAKKSELLRAGLQALAALDGAALVAALGRLEAVKVGRPKKGH